MVTLQPKLNLLTIHRNGKVLASQNVSKLSDLKGGFASKHKNSSKNVEMYFGLGFNHKQFQVPSTTDKVVVGEIILIDIALDYSFAETLYAISHPGRKGCIDWLANHHKINLFGLNKDLKEVMEDLGSAARTLNQSNYLRGCD